MADLASFRQSVEILRSRTRTGIVGLESLAGALTREAEYLRRRDQAECIAALRTRVAEDVADILLAENQAWHDFKWTNTTRAMGRLAAGWIKALRSKDGLELQTGARLAKAELSHEAPFGSVMVKIEPRGIPDAVKTISLSRLARESCKSESAIESHLVAGGDSLVAPETFLAALDELREDILKGKVCLPVTIVGLRRRIC